MEKKSSESRNDDKSPSEPKKGKILEHHKLGVWDLYLERDELLSYFPTSWKMEAYAGIWKDLPYLWQTIRDLCTVDGPLLSLYVVLTFARSLLPALTLWYSGQLLTIVESAIDNNGFDTSLLIRVAFQRALCSATTSFVNYGCAKLGAALDYRCVQYYSKHVFHAMARLDVPTWDEPSVAAQINGLIPRPPHSISWAAILTFSDTICTFFRIFSQTAVLFSVFRGQRDGVLFALLTFSGNLMYLLDDSGVFSLSRAWAATTRDNNFVRMEGFKRLVNEPKHRKELVAGGLVQHLVAEFGSLVNRVGKRAGDFWSVYINSYNDRIFRPISVLQIIVSELPMVVMALRAVQHPSSMPISLASLQLMQHASDSLLNHISTLRSNTGEFSDKLLALRRLLEAGNISNKVVDGTTPFPENEQSIRDGISLEFRNVSFQYPGSEKDALRDISFTVGRGQLCVILGSNGSGKSTILKLMARLYEPTKGTILIDGHDIKTLRLEDLRRAMAVLFQDYTIFPLSVRENIALGDPTHAHDDAAIEQAAHMGGASELIARLPNGLDSYLERPVRDIYEGLPDGSEFWGGKVDNEYLRGVMGTPANISLSGGEMQRLAVARTFMRSASAEQKVGLLLFDEPSASLDPTAEHDLFSRLRKLRGNKTMIFSTHRFGNLTRHADLILYMNESVVVEMGTHEELLNREGSDYARLWHIQAEAFR